MRRLRARGGYALIVVTMILATGSLFATLAFVDRVSDPHYGRNEQAELRTTLLAHASVEAYLQNGAFPTSLVTLGVLPVAASNELLTLDPYGGQSELDFQVLGEQLTVTSRGPDGQLGTSDDVAGSVLTREPGRARSRNRLRTLRAVFSRSQFMNSIDVTPTQREALLDAMRTYTIGCRHIEYATGVAYTDLLAQIGIARTTIEVITGSAGLPALPENVTGPGGLLEQLGLPDAQGYDGFGNELVVDVVGVNSIGGDGIAWTQDDF